MAIFRSQRYNKANNVRKETKVMRGSWAGGALLRQVWKLMLVKVLKLMLEDRGDSSFITDKRFVES